MLRLDGPEKACCMSCAFSDAMNLEIFPCAGCEYAKGKGNSHWIEIGTWQEDVARSYLKEPKLWIVMALGIGFLLGMCI